MSSHPNTYLVASITSPNDEFDFGELADETSEFSFVGEGNEQGIPVEGDCFGIYDHITYGWGDSINVLELPEITLKFSAKVDEFCKQHNFNLVSIRLGADWF